MSPKEGFTDDGNQAAALQKPSSTTIVRWGLRGLAARRGGCFDLGAAVEQAVNHSFEPRAWTNRPSCGRPSTSPVRWAWTRQPRRLSMRAWTTGSRVAICVPPASPHVSITERVLRSRRNILVSGGTGSEAAAQAASPLHSFPFPSQRALSRPAKSVRFCGLTQTLTSGNVVLWLSPF